MIARLATGGLILDYVTRLEALEKLAGLHLGWFEEAYPPEVVNNERRCGECGGNTHRGEHLVHCVRHDKRAGASGQARLKDGLPDSDLFQQPDYVKPAG